MAHPFADIPRNHPRPRERWPGHRRMRKVQRHARKVLRKELVAEAGRHDRWTYPPIFDWKAVFCGARPLRCMRKGWFRG